MTDTQAGSPLSGSDPERVGPYRLLRRLGSGTMGRVYLAVPGNTLTAHPVALKLIHAHLAEQKVFRRRFAHELAAMRRITSEHTADLLDADSDAEQPWFVSTYVPGPSIEAAVAERGPLPVSEVAAIGAGMIKGLRAIHAADIVHRDLKPANVLLGPRGPVIIDFGIARAADATYLTATGLHVGTFEFMSPEQASGGFVGPPSDTFALGSVLFYSATGQSPFTAATTPAICQLILNAPASPEAAAMIAPGLRATILSCLAKDPAARPSLEQVAESLVLIATDGDAAAAAPSAAPTELAPERVRRAATEAPAAGRHRPGIRSRIAWAGLAVILALAAGTTLTILHGTGLAKPAALPRGTAAPTPSPATVSSSPATPAAKSRPPANPPTTVNGQTAGATSPAVAGGQAPSSATSPATPQPTEQSTQARAPAAQPPTLLGAPNFNGYCEATNQGQVTLVSADYAYGWHCTAANSTGGDAQAVCEWTYHLDASQITNSVQDFYDPNSWHCWRITGQVSAPNWNGYCEATGHGAVSLTSDNAYGWHCADGSGLDINAVCERTNGTSPEIGRFQDFYDPNSWQCWR